MQTLQRLPFLLLALSCGSEELAVSQSSLTGRSWYVRPGQPDPNATGTTFADAWRGLQHVDWPQIAPGDTLYVCGIFIAQSLRPTAGVHGTESSPIVVSGACPANPGAILGTSDYGLRTEGRDHYRYEHLDFWGVAILVNDSEGSVFYDVELRNAPDGLVAAIDDRGIFSTFDNVRIFDSKGAGISQQARARNRTLTSLTKRDFQTRNTGIIVRDSLISGTSVNSSSINGHGVRLQWNKSVTIERTTITDAAGIGIFWSTHDAFETYPIGLLCPATACAPGLQCINNECLDTTNDIPGTRDGYDLGTAPIETTFRVTGNRIEQTAENNQCIYDGRPGACGNAHSAIAITGGPPKRGPITIDFNTLETSAGNGILIENQFEGVVSIQGNTIGRHANWGVWLSSFGPPYNTGTALISRNTFYEMGIPPPGPAAAGGVQINGPIKNVQVLYNTFVNNGHALSYPPAAKAAALVLAQGVRYSPHSIEVAHNIFEDNYAANMVTYYRSPSIGPPMHSLNIHHNQSIQHAPATALSNRHVSWSLTGPGVAAPPAYPQFSGLDSNTYVSPFSHWPTLPLFWVAGTGYNRFSRYQSNMLPLERFSTHTLP